MAKEHIHSALSSTDILVFLSHWDFNRSLTFSCGQRISQALQDMIQFPWDSSEWKLIPAPINKFTFEISVCDATLIPKPLSCKISTLSWMCWSFFLARAHIMLIYLIKMSRNLNKSSPLCSNRAQNGDKGDSADTQAPLLGVFTVRLNSQHHANPSQDRELHKNLAEMLCLQMVSGGNVCSVFYKKWNFSNKTPIHPPCQFIPQTQQEINTQ